MTNSPLCILTLPCKKNEVKNEVLKYLGGEIALLAEFNEFHALDILFSVMSVGKKVLVDYFDHVFC